MDLCSPLAVANMMRNCGFGMRLQETWCIRSRPTAWTPFAAAAPFTLLLARTDGSWQLRPTRLLAIKRRFVGPSFASNSEDRDAIYLNLLPLVQPRPGYARPANDSVFWKSEEFVRDRLAKVAEGQRDSGLHWVRRADRARDEAPGWQSRIHG